MTDATSAAEGLCAVTACRRHPADEWRLCRTHAGKLGQWLSDLDDLYATLDPRPAGNSDLDNRGAALASQRSPARLDILVLRDTRSRERDPDDPDGNPGNGVLEVLESWARLIREQRDLAIPTRAMHYVRACRPIGPICHEAVSEGPGCMHDTCRAWVWRGIVPTPATVTSERSLIANHLDWVFSQDWVNELHDDLRAVHRQLTGAHGITRAKPVGECPTLIINRECHGSLWADEDTGTVTCARCTRTFTPDELRHLGDMLIRQGHVEVFRAEWFTGVPAGTIRKWAAAGHIDSRKQALNGKPGRPKLLVTIADVEAMRDRHTRVAS